MLPRVHITITCILMVISLSQKQKTLKLFPQRIAPKKETVCSPFSIFHEIR